MRSKEEHADVAHCLPAVAASQMYNFIAAKLLLPVSCWLVCIHTPYGCDTRAAGQAKAEPCHTQAKLAACMRARLRVGVLSSLLGWLHLACCMWGLSPSLLQKFADALFELVNPAPHLIHARNDVVTHLVKPVGVGKMEGCRSVGDGSERIHTQAS